MKIAQNVYDESRGKRPVIITSFCSFGFMVAVTIISLFHLSPELRENMSYQYGKIHYPITMSLTLVGLVALFGYWKMKKWGVYLYTLVAAISITYGVIVQFQNMIGHVISIAIVGVGIMHLKNMT